MYRRTTFLAVIALALFSCATPPSQLIDKGEYDKAYQALAESKDAERAAQLERLAAIHFKAKRYDEAKKCFVSARNDPNAGLVAYGDFAVKEKNASEAMKAFKEAKAWDKSIALARDESTRLLSKGGVFASDYDSLRKYLGAAAPDVGTADREWAALLHGIALADPKRVYGLHAKQLVKAFDALKDPALMKERWKEVLQAIEKASGARSAAACIDDAYQGRPEGAALCAELARDDLAKGGGSRAAEYAFYSKDKELVLGASVAYARKQAEYKRKDIAYWETEGQNKILDEIQKDCFRGVGDAALVAKSMAEIALEADAPKSAIRLFTKAGDAEGVKRANLNLAEASLSWMANPSSFDYRAGSSAALFAAALGSESGAWKILGDKLLAVGQKRNAVKAYRAAGAVESAKPLLPAAAREYADEKNYEEAAVLYKEAGMAEESRGAIQEHLKAHIRKMGGSEFWYNSARRADAAALLADYWNTKRDALLALAGMAEEDEFYDIAAQIAEEAGDRAAAARFRTSELRLALAGGSEEAGFDIAKGIAKDDKGAWSLIFDAYAELEKYGQARSAGVKAGRKADVAAFLKKSAEKAADAEARGEIARALVQLGTPEARKTLASMAGDQDPAVAALALWSSGKGPKEVDAALVTMGTTGSMSMLGMAMSANVEATGQLQLAKERQDKGPYMVESVVEAALSAKPAAIEIPALEDARGVKSTDEGKLRGLVSSGDRDLYVVAYYHRFARSADRTLKLRSVDSYEVYLPAMAVPIRIEGENLVFEFDTSYATSDAAKEAAIEKAGRAVMAERKARLAELGAVLRFLRGR